MLISYKYNPMWAIWHCVHCASRSSRPHTRSGKRPTTRSHLQLALCWRPTHSATALPRSYQATSCLLPDDVLPASHRVRGWTTYLPPSPPSRSSPSLSRVPTAKILEIRLLERIGEVSIPDLKVLGDQPVVSTREDYLTRQRDLWVERHVEAEHFVEAEAYLGVASRHVADNLGE